MRDWYQSTPDSSPAESSIPLTWGRLLDNWTAIELDLHDPRYGPVVDIESGILKTRTWRWLELRVIDLVGQGGRLARALSTQK